jgi:hypothetical protein
MLAHSAMDACMLKMAIATLATMHIRTEGLHIINLWTLFLHPPFLYPRAFLVVQVCRQLRSALWNEAHAKHRLKHDVNVLGGVGSPWMKHCMILPTLLDRPVPRHPFPVNGGTIDIARSSETFPVTVSLAFTHNRKTYVAEPPQGLTRWVPLHPCYLRECGGRGPGPGPLGHGARELKGTPLMLSGLVGRPELNGVVVVADRLVFPATSEETRVRVLLDGGAALSVKASCCNVRAPVFQYDPGPVPLRFRLQVFKVGGKGNGYLWGPGFGVLALEDIPSNELVCVYWGKYNAAPSPTGESRTYLLTADAGEGRRWTVDPTDEGNIARWINHSSVSANIVFRPIPHPTDHSHPPLIGLFSGESGIPAGVELRWDYFNENPQRGTPHVPSIGKCAPNLSTISHELARDPVTGKQHRAEWTIKNVSKVAERVGNERSELKIDRIWDRDRLFDGEEWEQDDDDDDDDDDDGGADPSLDEEMRKQRERDSLIQGRISAGGRWEIPRGFWQASPRGFRGWEVFALKAFFYWEPVPLVGFPIMGQE